MAANLFNVGDWVSDFTLTALSGKPVKLSDTVGVPVALVFLGSDTAQIGAAQTACAGFAELYPKFSALHVPVLAIRPGAAGSDRLGGAEASDGAAGALSWPGQESLPFAVLCDVTGEISARYSAPRLRGALLSPNGRVFRFYDLTDPAGLAAQMLGDASGILNLEAPRHVLQQAPVLLIPDVIPPEFCRKLMDVWEKEGNQDSGFMVNAEDGKTVGKYDYSNKIRRDHFIPRGNDLDRECRGWLGRHIAGEVYKAFNYEVTRLEDMKIACYDAARGGYFRPHRDNTTGATAHRKFAASILLNDEYEGGFLRFPEYGPHVYRPKAGAAVIFGCSLLHEATDVTKGRRFVLLTFLYGEKEAKMREEYAKKTGGAYRASS
ncbi:MAG: 2OG-Fe(II) oxygenase [Tepidisphaeraceae bacterium]|jgi:predicted 2-oxoglutarate/Fe(II)-dependent dioxygenase YbiX